MRTGASVGEPLDLPKHPVAAALRRFPRACVVVALARTAPGTSGVPGDGEAPEAGAAVTHSPLKNLNWSVGCTSPRTRRWLRVWPCTPNTSRPSSGPRSTSSVELVRDTRTSSGCDPFAPCLDSSSRRGAMTSSSRPGVLGIREVRVRSTSNGAVPSLIPVCVGGLAACLGTAPNRSGCRRSSSCSTTENTSCSSELASVLRRFSISVARGGKPPPTPSGPERLVERLRARGRALARAVACRGMPVRGRDRDGGARLPWGHGLLR